MAKTNSNLERVLEAGQFAVTGELGPPLSADTEAIRKKAKTLKGYVDAFNVTDGQTAVTRMSSWATGLIAREEGMEHIVQMTCRDRNRLALQMDILGAAGVGINNILCLTGDHITFGNHPEQRPFTMSILSSLLRSSRICGTRRNFSAGTRLKGLSHGCS